MMNEPMNRRAFLGLIAGAAASSGSLQFALEAVAASFTLPEFTAVRSLSWSKNDKQIAAGLKTGAPRLFNVVGEMAKTNKMINIRASTQNKRNDASAKMDLERWYPVAISPDGTKLAVAHYLRVYIYDLKNDSRFLWSGKTGSHWSLYSFEEPSRHHQGGEYQMQDDGWLDYASYVTALSWNSSSRKLAVSDANGVHIIDMKTGNEAKNYTGTGATVFCTAWQPNGNLVACCSGYAYAVMQPLHVFDATTGDSVFQGKDALQYLAWSADGKYLATDHMNGISILDSSNNKFMELNRIDTADDITTFAWSPSSKLIAVSDRKKNVCVYDAKTGKLRASHLDQHEKSRRVDFSSFAWSRNQDVLAVGQPGESIDIWQPKV